MPDDCEAASQVNIQPLHDRVLLERLPRPNSLITLTDAEKYRKFKVLKTGPGKWIEEGDERYFYPVEVKPGDIVVLPGIASDGPDDEKGTQIWVTEGDIGWKVG